jgi:hypothetical protein
MSWPLELVVAACVGSLTVSAIMLCVQLQRIARGIEAHLAFLRAVTLSRHVDDPERRPWEDTA